MTTRMAAMAALCTAALLGGCATQPLGPSVPAMPGQGKSMEAFEKDDQYCQDYAANRASGRVQQANDNELRNGVLGAALGAGLGALAGNTKGAVAGGLIGGAIGTTATAGGDQYHVQRLYDISYAQCMRARGNDVPGPRRPRRWMYGPPPPPPPGY
ncbi:MAG: glycine zipper family protein [Alphaproteobacteria bacterium]|nr:glycine zipper family protein [Alphaproteobacteria bacterium]MBV9694061.1 glycine zipper family protein [Alphaproteobacteria bacterium]